MLLGAFSAFFIESPQQPDNVLLPHFAYEETEVGRGWTLSYLSSELVLLKPENTPALGLPVTTKHNKQ